MRGDFADFNAVDLRRAADGDLSHKGWERAESSVPPDIEGVTPWSIMSTRSDDAENRRRAGASWSVDLGQALGDDHPGCGLDQSEVREGLREVPEVPAGLAVEFLRV